MRTLQSVGNQLPHLTDEKGWTVSSEQDWEEVSGGYWTGSFWAGILWLLYDLTGNDQYRETAYGVCDRLAPRKKGKGHHDLGFVFFPSFCVGYRMTRDTGLKRIALEAAESLGALFDRDAGVIPTRKFVRGERRILAIDTMMNLPLLWWAHHETRSTDFLRIATSHADVSAGHLIRGDGSTVHLAEFGVQPFRLIRALRLQGYSNDSCWARGLSWGIYGLTFAYGTTGKETYLNKIGEMLKFYVEQVPEDFVPFYDFADPCIPGIPRDSSSAAITASALVELGSQPLEPGHPTGTTCEEFGRSILQSLMTRYQVDDAEGFLAHGCFHRPERIGVDCSMIFSDYYFLEALWKLHRGKKMADFKQWEV